MPKRTRALPSMALPAALSATLSGALSAALSAALLGLFATAPPAAAAAARHHGRAPLRIATYNIHAGSGVDEVFDLDRQAAALRALDADVIGLQEVDVHWGARSHGLDVARELAGRLG